MNDWVSEWVNEWMSEWVSEWMNDWVSEWVSEWVNEWLSEWVSEWVSWGSQSDIQSIRLSLRLQLRQPRGPCLLVYAEIRNPLNTWKFPLVKRVEVSSPYFVTCTVFPVKTRHKFATRTGLQFGAWDAFAGMCFVLSTNCEPPARRVWWSCKEGVVVMQGRCGGPVRRVWWSCKGEVWWSCEERCGGPARRVWHYCFGGGEMLLSCLEGLDVLLLRGGCGGPVRRVWWSCKEDVVVLRGTGLAHLFLAEPQHCSQTGPCHFVQSCSYLPLPHIELWRRSWWCRLGTTRHPAETAV